MSERTRPSGRGCIRDALQLKERNLGRGAVYYVSYTYEKEVMHAYYLLDSEALSELALNQADNGYGDYPQLTTAEVLLFGFPLPDDVNMSQLQGLIQDHWFDLDT
jgi:hypothetical protein